MERLVLLLLSGHLLKGYSVLGIAYSTSTS